MAGLAQESLTRTQDQYLAPTLDTRSRGNFPAVSAFLESSIANCIPGRWVDVSKEVEVGRAGVSNEDYLKAREDFAIIADLRFKTLSK